MKRHCPYCGPYTAGTGSSTFDGQMICSFCGMTPEEHAYRARILADSAAVYAAEHREFQARRAAERAA